MFKKMIMLTATLAVLTGSMVAFADGNPLVTCGVVQLRSTEISANGAMTGSTPMRWRTFAMNGARSTTLPLTTEPTTSIGVLVCSGDIVMAVSPPTAPGELIVQMVEYPDTVTVDDVAAGYKSIIVYDATWNAMPPDTNH